MTGAPAESVTPRLCRKDSPSPTAEAPVRRSAIRARVRAGRPAEQLGDADLAGRLSRVLCYLMTVAPADLWRRASESREAVHGPPELSFDPEDVL